MLKRKVGYCCIERTQPIKQKKQNSKLYQDVDTRAEICTS